MKRLVAVLLVLLVPVLVNAGQPLSSKELVQQRAIEKLERKRVAKAWAEFTSRFVIRQTVPIYSGAYQIGSRVVVTPNYPAIEEYRQRLEAAAWSSMTDQQKRDMALFIVARNTGLIAANTAVIAANTCQIAEDVREIEDELRRQELNRMIDQFLGR